MVSTSKILTVSYGTFSCTLEGFDDSFDTMKAIAEYFRDLAADDRYFGAEPPTPDAEMLARIAEREVARRVEARSENGQIVLRTGASATPTDAAANTAYSAVPSTRDTTEPPSADSMLAEDETPQAEVAAPVMQDTAETQATAPLDSDIHDEAEPVAPALVQEAESVADKLRRIRAVATPASLRFDNTYTEDEHAQDFLGSTATDLEAVLAEDDANERAAVALSDDDTYEDEEDILAHLAIDASDGPDAAETADAAPQPTVNDETEDAPVSAETPIGQSTDHAEVAPASDADDQVMPDALIHDSAEDDAETAAAGHDTAPPAEIEAAAPQAPEHTDADSAMGAEQMYGDGADSASDDEALEALLATAEEPADEYTDFAFDSAADDDDDTLDSEDMPGDGVEIKLAAEDTLAQLMADALRDDPSAVSATTKADAQDAITEESAEGETPRTETPPAAWVIKVKRREVEDAIADGTFQEALDDITESPVAATETSPPDASSLSDEDEAELQLELAAVEAELQQTRGTATTPKDASERAEAPAANSTIDWPEDTQANNEPASETPEATPKRGKRLEPLAADAQAPRMFDEAATQLEEPESHQRRNAMQHLRAAVAATKAERSAGGAMQEDVDDKPYRLDLETAVRPRRPHAVSGNGERSERPRRERPSPLKLVAEQRIDTPPTEPVQPRRIRRADLDTTPQRRPPEAEAPEHQATAAHRETQRPAPEPEAAAAPAAQDTGGFTGFAEEMGVRALPDLLEAAAAYMADVEGQPEFSRPMLMHKLKEVSAADFSREEGLRSFGKLLRDGKLQKLKGGRFTVTDATDFRPRARAAG